MFSSLALSVCCIVPFMFSHMLLPFVITPGLLPPLSSPVPCLFISVCVFVSVYSLHSLSGHFICQPVRSCSCACSYLCSCLCSCLFPVPSSLWYVFLDFCILHFDLNFGFDLCFAFLGCTLSCCFLLLLCLSSRFVCF